MVLNALAQSSAEGLCLYPAPEAAHVLTSLCARVSASVCSSPLHVMRKRLISALIANRLIFPGTNVLDRKHFFLFYPPLESVREAKEAVRNESGPRL